MNHRISDDVETEISKKLLPSDEPNPHIALASCDPTTALQDAMA
jgi:hypothetical protein